MHEVSLWLFSFDQFYFVHLSITCGLKIQSSTEKCVSYRQVFGGSPQLPTIAKGKVIRLLSTLQTMKQCSTVVGGWEEPPDI